MRFIDRVIGRVVDAINSAEDRKTPPYVPPYEKLEDIDDPIHSYCQGQCDSSLPQSEPSTEAELVEEESAPIEELGTPVPDITVPSEVTDSKDILAHTIGSAFEQQVFFELQGICSCFAGEVFYNIVIPKCNSGSTTEIDLVAITPSRVFVIECKAWHGIVYANFDKELNWIVYNSGKSYKNYSPLKQNNTHMKCLAAFLELDLDFISSIVVFPDDTTIKDIEPATEYSFVGHLSELNQFIAALSMSGRPYLPYFGLLRLKLRDIQQKSEYRSECHRHMMERRRDNNICPVCGLQLVMRTRHSDDHKFYGCLGYPRCHYTREI